MGSLGEVVLSSGEVLKIVQRYFSANNINNFEILNYQFRPFSENTQGFLASHRFLHVYVQVKSSESTAPPVSVVEHELQFFAKLAPVHSAALLKYVEEFRAFEKECNSYNHVLPRLQTINTGTENFTAKCFLARRDIIILENLAARGYRLGAAPDGILDYKHLQCAIRSLANMHSASIVLERQRNGLISKLYPQCIAENSYPDNSTNLRCTYVGFSIRTLCNLIPLIPKYKNDPNLDKIIEEFANMMKQIFELTKTSGKYRNVFSHGDLWANNLLFRYDDRFEGNSCPIDCKLVDFQLARYAPPAVDILTVLTIPTTREFRREHLKALLENYYQYLAEFLADHNIQIEDEISKEEFWRSVKHYKLAGLIESCLFCHIVLLPPDVANNLCKSPDGFEEFLSSNRIRLCTNAFQTDITYCERLTDTISDIIDNYVANVHST